MKLISWSRGGGSWSDERMTETVPGASLEALQIEPGGRFHRAMLEIESGGTLVLELWSPRPLRMWLDGVSILDEPLHWRSYQRHLRAAVVLPVAPGRAELRVELGERPRHPEHIDRDCPSRNRARVMASLARILPDELRVSVRELPDTTAPATSLRFTPSQFHLDGIVWQEVIARAIHTGAPSTQLRSLADRRIEIVALSTAVAPGRVHESTTDDDRRAGLRRLHVPVAAPHTPNPVLRQPARETRVEPVVEEARREALTVEGAGGAAVVSMPTYEERGRHAPRREYRELVWPSESQLLAAAPEPVLPKPLAHLKKLHDEAWRMLLRIVKHPRPESGLPNAYVSTGAGFANYQFVWDTSFAAMATAYAWRVFPTHASLDVLYSHQFDGGYIHREIDVRDALPALYEPDFSPNPPLMAVAELAIARLSGNTERLRRVYRPLVQHHEWLESNRGLADGTFWTTGLANGLDNSPSLGDGYPDLTAQMAHHADALSKIAESLGLSDESARWRRGHAEIGAACNERLWSDAMKFYSTSLPDGGHNRNKVVTGFWPLWAGIVPADRVEHLAAHAKDPASFWRHHPLPSLAADSPEFKPEGNYWLGSTWAPTNCAAIKGFARAGRLDVAREILARHLQCMYEVLESTGSIWENYCSEASAPGSWAGTNYCWSAVGPIALLYEVTIGLEPDALQRTITWTPPSGEHIGVKRYPLGPCTVDLVQEPRSGQDVVEVRTDLPFTLRLVRGGRMTSVACRGGRTRLPA